MSWLDYVILGIIALAFIIALLYCIKNNKNGCANCDKYGQCPFKNEKQCHKNK